MNKETSKNTQPKEMSAAALSDQIGVSNLKEIIDALALPQRDAYVGEQLQEILAVHSKMKELRTDNVSRAVSAYLESIDDKKSEEKSSQKTTASSTKKKKGGRVTRKKKEVDSDLQQHFIKGKEGEAQATVLAGVQDGQKLAAAYRHGRQVGFLKQVLSDTVTDATLIKEQLGNITDSVLNDTTIDVDALLGDIKIPEFGDVNSVEQISDGDGLGFTGILGDICQGYLPEGTEEDEEAA
ncbi:MAG: hypothetical protein WA919_10255 [Coleofasciculaceae cyanobacterium]